MRRTIEARVTPEQKRLFAHAAALEGRPLTDFLLEGARTAAAETISRHQLNLTPEDQRVFVDALQKALSTRHRTMLQSGPKRGGKQRRPVSTMTFYDLLQTQKPSSR